MMESTSRPTYPTSVNLVTSTLMKGELVILANLLAISVLPTPVGPIISMFLGIISSRNSLPIFFLRYLFLKATATALFASSCPIIYLSSLSTISLGVNSSMALHLLLFPHLLYYHWYKYRFRQQSSPPHRLYLLPSYGRQILS